MAFRVPARVRGIHPQAQPERGFLAIVAAEGLPIDRNQGWAGGGAGLTRMPKSRNKNDQTRSHPGDRAADISGHATGRTLHGCLLRAPSHHPQNGGGTSPTSSTPPPMRRPAAITCCPTAQWWATPCWDFCPPTNRWACWGCTGRWWIWVSRWCSRYDDIRAVALGGEISFTWSDATERVEAGRLLEDSEQAYRLLAQNSTDVVVRLRAGINIWTSASVTAMFGWLPEEWVGHQAAELLPPEGMEGYRTVIAATEPGEQVVVRPHRRPHRPAQPPGSPRAHRPPDHPGAPQWSQPRGPDRRCSQLSVKGSAPPPATHAPPASAAAGGDGP
jgi:PAS domain-containing protein